MNCNCLQTVFITTCQCQRLRISNGSYTSPIANRISLPFTKGHYGSVKEKQFPHMLRTLALFYGDNFIVKIQTYGNASSFEAAPWQSSPDTPCMQAEEQRKESHFIPSCRDSRSGQQRFGSRMENGLRMEWRPSFRDRSALKTWPDTKRRT